jgi:hypothetical protein
MWRRAPSAVTTRGVSMSTTAGDAIYVVIVISIRETAGGPAFEPRLTEPEWTIVVDGVRASRSRSSKN